MLYPTIFNKYLQFFVKNNKLDILTIRDNFIEFVFSEVTIA